MSKAMWTVKLWHAKRPTFTCPVSAPTDISLDYAHVDTFCVDAESEADATEEVFNLSQNFDEYWKEGQRSTSVGDLLEVTTQSNGLIIFAVDNVGMKVLTQVQVA